MLLWFIEGGGPRFWREYYKWLGHDHIQWQTQLIRQYTNLRTYYRTGLYYRFWPYYQIVEVSITHWKLANRGRLLLWTPGPVSFGTCICSNVETIISWNCHVRTFCVSNIPRYYFALFMHLINLMVYYLYKWVHNHNGFFFVNLTRGTSDMYFNINSDASLSWVTSSTFLLYHCNPGCILNVNRTNILSPYEDHSKSSVIHLIKDNL